MAGEAWRAVCDHREEHGSICSGTGKKHRLQRGRGSAGFNHPQSAQCNGLRELAPVQHRCTFCLPLSSSGNFQHNTVHMQYPSDNLMFALPPRLDTLYKAFFGP